MIYTRDEIESKLRQLAVSGDPKARELAASIRAQLIELDDDLAADEESDAPVSSGPVVSSSGTSYRVTSREDVAAVRAMLREGRQAYGTKRQCPGRSR